MWKLVYLHLRTSDFLIFARRKPMTSRKIWNVGSRPMRFWSVVTTVSLRKKQWKPWLARSVLQLYIPLPAVFWRELFTDAWSKERVGRHHIIQRYRHCRKYNLPLGSTGSDYNLKHARSENVSAHLQHFYQDMYRYLLRGFARFSGPSWPGERPASCVQGRERVKSCISSWIYPNASPIPYL